SVSKAPHSPPNDQVPKAIGETWSSDLPRRTRSIVGSPFLANVHYVPFVFVSSPADPGWRVRFPPASADQLLRRHEAWASSREEAKNERSRRRATTLGRSPYRLLSDRPARRPPVRISSWPLRHRQGLAWR